MAIGTTELETLRDALIRARAQGLRSVFYDGKRVEYGTDAEMRAAIADLDRRIAGNEGRAIGQIRISTSKGLL